MRPLQAIALLLLVSLVFSSCEKEEPGFSGAGKVPVYVNFENLQDIRNTEPQAITQSGPIFLIGDFFFMIEQGQGIHVFDIADEAQVSPLTFIKIPAVSDFTIDGGFLYADSWRDLVTINVSNIFQVEVVNRQADIFEPFLFPQFFVGPFECVDESKGAVIAWEDEELTGVLCNTF